MIDIKLIRDNKDLVKENIKKKFQDHKLPLVDEVEALDKEYRNCKLEGDRLRSEKNNKSSEIGNLMREGKREEAEALKQQIADYGTKIQELETREQELEKEIKERMMMIPNIIDDSVPVGEDDSCNVEIEKFGEPIVPDYEIPYHADICETLDGLDKEIYLNFVENLEGYNLEPLIFASQKENYQSYKIKTV